jgi:hypothetical protein
MWCSCMQALADRGFMRRRFLALVLAVGLASSCGDNPVTPSASTESGRTFAVLSTSPAPGGTVALPDGFFVFPQGNGWVRDLTMTIRFTYAASISKACADVVLWRGSEQCVIAEGLVQGAPYGNCFRYEGGSTLTLSGNSFTGTFQCRGGAARRFTTDRVQFLLMDANKPVDQRTVFTRDVSMGWTFE